MQCVHCQAINTDERRFCAQCGKALTLGCPACGFENQPDARFCGGCGESLPDTPARSRTTPPGLEAERRQVTVMFCDLVGSTELSRRLDPEDLRALLDRYQATVATIVERFDGYVARYVGDGILAYFGYPTAHEDDAQSAVRAGLAIAGAVSQMETEATSTVRPAVRIGINTGLVVAGDIGRDGRREQMAIVGETPNVAARLQALAEPDTVIIGESTRRLVEGLFVYEPLGPQRLRGLSEPVAAYRVRAESDARSRFEASALRGLTPLVGREHEIGLLVGRWRHAREGDGQVVLLSGEAGVGKSRIVRGFQDHIRDELRHRILYLCSPYHQGSAFYPVTDQIRRGLRFADGDTPDARLDKLDALLRGLELPVQDYAPIIASLLSLPQGSRYPPMTLSPQELKRKILEAITAVIEAMAVEQPTLVVAEDVHWADASTLELLELLMARAADLALLVVITFRPEFEPRWRVPGHATSVSLSRLSRRETAELVSNVAGGKRLPRSLVDAIVARTDGVPLFVEELTKSLLESGMLRERGDELEPAGELPAAEIPTSLQDSLVARLDRLGPVKEVAQLAATIGRRFSFDLLNAVSDAGEAELNDALDRLIDSGLVYRQRVSPGAIYEFKHALVRDSAYATLLKSRRQQYHRRIAEALQSRFPEVAESEPMLMAHHHAEGAQVEQAIPFWLRAGDLFHQRGSIRMSIAAYRNVIDAGADRAARCRAWIGVAAGMRIIDRYDDAFAALDTAEREAQSAGLSEELSRIHHLRGNLYFPLGKGEACRGAHAKALEYAREIGSPQLEAQALGGLGDAEYVRARMRTANEYFRDCVELCRRHGLSQTEAANLSMVGHTRMYLNELREAVDDGLASIELARKIGHLRAEVNARLVTVFVCYELGEWEHANAHIEQASELIERLGARRFLPPFLRYRARILYAEGDHSRAMDLLERAVEIHRETGPAFDGPRTLAFLAYATEDDKVREESLAEGERIIEEGCVGHNVLFFYRDAIDVALKLGQWKEVGRYAASLEAYTRAEPLPWSDFFIARARALAAHGAGRRDARFARELERLREEAARVGFRTVVEPIEQALAC